MVDRSESNKGILRRVFEEIHERELEEFKRRQGERKALDLWATKKEEDNGQDEV